ncbi:hypothetical protein D3C83_206580 [compost metagenome]
MSPAQDQFGEDRVAELAGEGGRHEVALLDRLFAQVKEFEAGGPQSDDIAAILLKLKADGRDG